MIGTLRKKFVFITMILVTAVLVAVFAGIILYYSNSLRSESYRTLESILEKPPGNEPAKIRIGDKLPDNFRRAPVFVVTIDEQGAPVLSSSEDIDISDAELAQITAAVLQRGSDQGELPDYDLRFKMQERDGTAKIAFITLALEQTQLQRLVITTGLAVIGAFIIFLAASTLLARWALKPVEKSWQRQRRFVADASHELKTPLTVILANTGILKSHPQDTIAQQLDWVDNTEKEAQRMKGLVDDLLFLAKSDDMTVTVPYTPVNVSDIVNTTALAFESVAFEQGKELEIEVQPKLTVVGNEAQLHQLIGILMDNAVKYSKPGGSIWLTLKQRQNQAVIAVRNLGEAIEPEQQKHLFERFYRVDSSRAREGYGLGLSIAQSIVEKHRGQITVTSDDRGNTFTVFLPVCK